MGKNRSVGEKGRPAGELRWRGDYPPGNSQSIQQGLSGNQSDDGRRPRQRARRADIGGAQGRQISRRSLCRRPDHAVPSSLPEQSLGSHSAAASAAGGYGRVEMVYRKTRLRGSRGPLSLLVRGERSGRRRHLLEHSVGKPFGTEILLVSLTAQVEGKDPVHGSQVQQPRIE